MHLTSPTSALNVRTLARCAICACLALLTTATAAQGKLVPPAGPWPAPIAAAVNPLLGTPYVANGGNATANAQLELWLPVHHKHRTALTRAIVQSTVIRGHLRSRDNHHAIRGATVTIVSQDVLSDQWAPIANARTSRRGDFHATLPAGYHRRVAALYWPAAASPGPIYSRRVLVRAKSYVTLPAPYHRRRAYRFDGQVLGGTVPIPTGGLIVGLQVRNSQGLWLTAALQRTTGSGRFRIRYTFPARGSLRVRVIAPSQPSWPLYRGTSRVRAVHPR